MPDIFERMFDAAAGDGIDAHVCAAAADSRSPLCSGLISALDDVAVPLLDAPAAVDAAVGFDRVVNRATALRLEAVATAVRRTLPLERVDPERAVAAEIGGALAIGPRAANAEVSYAWELTGRLRRTWSLMHVGDLAYAKARLLVDETLDLTDEQALAVEEAVIGMAVERTWAQHAAAVRRAVVRVDPLAPERRRKNADRASRLVRRYGNDGLADLVVTLPTAQIDAAYTGADAWARARKAAGDDRPLEQLRAEAFVRWATSFLTHGDPTTCDRDCAPVDPATSTIDSDSDSVSDAEPVADAPAGVDPETGEIVEAPPSRRIPIRHGRPLRVGLIWDLQALLGLTDSPGELLDSGEMISAADLRALLTGGIRLRRLLVDPDTGELVDLTPGSWLMPADPRCRQASATPGHGQPIWLGIVVDNTTWRAWQDRTLTGTLATAVTLAPKAVRDLMDAPRTDATLDDRPDAEHPSAALAEFVAVRDRHPTNPSAAPTAAGAGDLDHITPRSAGGPTTRANLHAPTRRWHLLRTVGGWRLRRTPEGSVTWISPHGRSYRTGPHNYLGP